MNLRNVLGYQWMGEMYQSKPVTYIQRNCSRKNNNINNNINNKLLHIIIGLLLLIIFYNLL